MYEGKTKEAGEKKVECTMNKSVEYDYKYMKGKTLLFFNVNLDKILDSEYLTNNNG